MDERLWMRYWRRALWVTFIFKHVPYVRMVGLNGSMVTGTLHAHSDIDFYVVVEAGHIFTTRFLLMGVLQLLGLRPTVEMAEGKICLNWLGTTNSLDITAHNSHHAREFHNLIPLFSMKNTYERFCAQNNWMGGYGYEPYFHEPVLRHGVVGRIIQGIGEIILALAPFLERQAHLFQVRRVQRDPRTYIPGGDIVVSSRELKFRTGKEVKHG